MRIIVTGGSGFIGSHLVDDLIEKNYEVIVIDLISNHSDTKNLNNKAKHYFADLANPTILKKIIKKDDYIIHLAAQSHVDVAFKYPNQTIVSNVVSTQNIMQSSFENNVAKVLIMSTDEVYGSHDSVTDFNSLDPTNPYSASKAAADMIVNSYKHMYPEMKINTLRSNNIAGPRQFIRNIIPRFSCLGLLNKKLTIHGNGSSKRRYLWVKDATSALIKIIESDQSGKIYHTSHPNQYTNLEIAHKIIEYLNIDKNIELVDDRLFNDTTYPFHKDDMIENELGWKVTRDIDDFLPETIESYRDNINIYRKFFN